MKLYFRVNRDDTGPWDSKRLVKLFNMIASRVVGEPIFYLTEGEAIDANRHAGAAGNKTVTVEISSSDDPCDNLSTCGEAAKQVKS